MKLRELRTKRIAEILIKPVITREELRFVIDNSSSMRADTLDDLLNRCPEWVAENAAREAAHAEKEAMFDRIEAPIVADMLAIGFDIRSVWDFVNTKERYPLAIPVLLKHLELGYHERIHEGIIRALMTPDARGKAEDIILGHLLHEKNKNIRWVLAHALTVIASKKQLEDIQALHDNPAFEDVKERLAATLKRLTRAKKSASAKRSAR